MSSTDKHQTIEHQTQRELQRFNHFDAFLILVLALGALILLRLFLRESEFVDDATYFEYSSQFLQGNFGRPTTANLCRLGFIGIVSLSQLIFGYSLYAYYVVPFLFGALLPVSIYLVSHCFFSRGAAFVAAVLAVCNPIFLEYGTILRIDVPGLVVYMLGLYLFICAFDTERTDLKRFMLGLLAGALFFLSMWIKEGMLPLIAALPLLCTLLPTKNCGRGKILLAVVLGGLIGVSVELVLNGLLFDNPLHRVQSILGGHVSGTREAWVKLKLVDDSLSWWKLLSRYPYHFLSNYFGKTLILFTAVLGFLSFFVLRRSLVFFGLLAIAGFLFVSLAVTSLDPLIPLLRTKDRYFSIAYYPLLIFLVGTAEALLIAALYRVKNPFRKRLFVLTLLVLAFSPLLKSGIEGEWSRWYYSRNGADAMAQARKIALQLDKNRLTPVNRVLSGKRTLRVLKMHLPPEYHSKLVSLDYTNGPFFTLDSTSHYLPGDLLVLNLSRLKNNQRYFYKNTLPDFLFTPPIHWELRGQTKWRTFRIYYIRDPLTTRVTRRTLPHTLRLLHAYPFKKDGRITVIESSDGLSFKFDNVSDGRIVSGAGKYHKLPDKQISQLQIIKPALLELQVHGSIRGEITVRQGHLVLFQHNKERPDLIPLTLQTGKNSFQAHTRLELSPEQYSAFRIMISCAGDGTLSVNKFEIKEVEF